MDFESDPILNLSRKVEKTKDNTVNFSTFVLTEFFCFRRFNGVDFSFFAFIKKNQIKIDDRLFVYNNHNIK